MMVMHDGTKTIELPNPDSSEHFRVEAKAFFKTSMSGIIYGKRSSVRPKGLALSFSNLPRLKAQELEDFVKEASGKSVTMVDRDSAIWLGKLTLQNYTFITEERGLGAGVPEFASVSIEFAGAKQ